LGANDIATLDAVIDSVRTEADPRGERKESEFFDNFVAALLLKEKDLPAESVRAGITDGDRDCGIDAFYTFLEGSLLESGHTNSKADPPRFEVVIIQCKRSTGFDEEAITQLGYYLPKLLRLSDAWDLEEVRGFANDRIIDRVRVFLDAYTRLAGRRPQVELSIHYATRGAEVHPNLRARADVVAADLSSLIRGCTVTIQFQTAGDLLDMHRARPSLSRELKSAVAPMYSESEQAYACLVRFSDYFELLTNEHGDLDQELFEFNVRDHVGDEAVNKSIRQTLEEGDRETEFWWLNNGVTIIASRIEPLNKRLIMTDPQIVNGLQTSTEIFRHMKDRDEGNDDRLVLVRAVTATEASIRDDIVRATNSQNPMPASALRSTDRLHHNIEDGFKSRGFYYERRHKFYENQGMPHDRLVTMRRLGQAIASVLIQRPDLARDNSSRLFEEDEFYTQLFSQNYSENVYFNSLLVLRRCEQAVRSSDIGSDGLVEDWSYLLAAVSMIMYFKKHRPSHQDIPKLNIAHLPAEALTDLLPLIAIEYRKASATRSVPFRELASNREVCKAVMQRAASFTTSKNWRSWPQVRVEAQYAVKPGESVAMLGRFAG
jgi:hypothetical protein